MTTDKEVDDYLIEIAAKLGLNFVPTLFKQLKHKPQLLRSIWGVLESTLLEGELHRLTKEMIIVVTSNEKHCQYCSVAHKAIGKQLGLSNSLIQCMDGDLRYIVPEKLQLLLRFTQSLASNHPDEAARLKLKLVSSGYTDREIEEAVTIVGAASLLSTIANGMALNNKIDQEFTNILDRVS